MSSDTDTTAALKPPSADRRHPRDALLTTATRLFRERGYAGVGVAEMLEASGAPRGSLYFHFPGGKEQIAEESVRLAGARMDRFVAKLAEQTDDFDDFIDALFVGWGEGIKESGYTRGCGVALIALETAATSDRLRAATEAVFAQWRASLSAFAVKHGFAPVEAERLAIMVLAAMQGAIVMCKSSRSTEPMAEAAFAIKAAARALRAL
jgi:TetR/AcrR family transcriptional repressor of lmrAB and yxaGH operons